MKDRSLYLEVSSCCPAMEVIDCTNSFWKALTLARDMGVCPILWAGYKVEASSILTIICKDE